MTNFTNTTMCFWCKNTGIEYLKEKGFIVCPCTWFADLSDKKVQELEQIAKDMNLEEDRQIMFGNITENLVKN